jgi:hypothetical protein
MPMPNPQRMELLFVEAREWWIAFDGQRVVGFAGDDARQRASKYFSDLRKIATRQLRFLSPAPAREGR